jgi:hypothetical protein
VTRRTRRAGLRLAATLAALLGAGAAAAGVRVELRSAPTPPAKGKALRYVVWIDGPRLAAELTRKDGAPPTRRIVFRSIEDLVWLVDTQRQTYYQLDPTSAQQAASQVAGLRQGLESGLESLTPEQRAAVRDLLGELAKPPQGPAPEYRLRERGELGRYAEIACARHDVLEGERSVAELCLADYGKPPLVRESLAAVPALGGFLQRTLEPLLREFPSLRPLAPLSALSRVDGVPLLVRSASEKGESRDAVVTRIEEAPVDAALFELPAGFARSWIPPFR